MAARRVYVGRLPYDVRERDIERFFKTYGPVREVLIKDGFAFVEFDSLRDAEDAVRYMNGRDLKGERVHVEFARGPPRGGRGGGPGGRGGSGSRGGGGPGSRFRNNYSGRSGGDSASGGDRGRGGGVTYAEKYGPPRNTEYRVIIENLSSRVSWQDLKDFMRRAGEVTFADAHKRERNMGIVDFASYSDMKNAIDTLTGEELHGKRIRVVEDKSRRNYDRGSNNRGSRGGARSRSRSRSKSRSRSRSRSKSRSRSRSRGGARNNVSRSRSRTRSRSRSRSLSRSRGRQQKRQSRSRSRSRSRSKVKASASRSRSRSNSRSRSPISRSRSRSNSLTRRQQPQLHSSRKITSRSRSASRSRSRSPEDRRSRSRNGSPKQMRSRSRSDERQSNNHVHDSKQENNRSSASPDGHDGYDRIKKESNEHEDD